MEAKLDHWLYLARNLWNAALEQHSTLWQNRKYTVTKKWQARQIKDIRKEFPEYKAANCQMLHDVVKRLDLAFQAFFRRVKEGNQDPGYPTFKGKNSYRSFTLSCQSGWKLNGSTSCQPEWKLNGNSFVINRLGRMRLRMHRPIEGVIKTINVSKTKSGKWFVSFSCDGIPDNPQPETRKSIGLDLGLIFLVADSEGKTWDAPKFLRQSAKEMRVLERAKSRKPKGSRNRNKARLQVSKLHEKISNQRKNFAEQVALYYAQNYDLIVMEDLQIKNMAKNPRLAKSIMDAGWYRFRMALTAKCQEFGRELIAVDPAYTSQMCSDCGDIVKKSLSNRTHCCEACGLIMDRDLNAAKNILQLGIGGGARKKSRGKKKPPKSLSP